MFFYSFFSFGILGWIDVVHAARGVLVEHCADISANGGVNEIKCVRVWMRCYSKCQPSKHRISCSSQPTEEKDAARQSRSESETTEGQIQL